MSSFYRHREDFDDNFLWLAADNVVTMFVEMNGQVLAIYGNMFTKCHNRFCAVSQLHR